MIRIAIDPGANGGIAWQESGCLSANAMNMPDTLRDIYDALFEIADTDDRFCVIEKVGTYMPGNSGPSAATFAEHVGTLKMALIAAQIPHEFVTPQKWQAVVIGKPAYPKIPKEVQGPPREKILADRKRERKNKIKAKVQEVYPHIKVTLATADALAMLWYMEQTRGQS